jgi:phosphatidylethanolamine N-methyltransferase
MLTRALANADWKWVTIAGASVVASPLIWNIIARNEYRNKTLTRLTGSATRGCYTLAAWIFLSSLVRDKLIDEAIQRSKPASLPLLGEHCAPATLRLAGKALMAAGMGLVAASYYRLGIVNTYLGDYFGLLMPARVTEFPFNFSWMPDPMYTGASVGFLGLAVHEDSPVGVLLTAWVWAVYKVSTTCFEDKFTAMIYEKAAAEKEAATKTAAPAAGAEKDTEKEQKKTE